MKEKKYWLVLHADTCDEWNTDVNSAVIEITAKRVKDWIDKMKFACNLRKKNENFRQMEFYDSIVWLRAIKDENDEHAQSQEPSLEEDEDLVDEENQQVICTEVDRIVVMDDAISFSANIDNSDILCEIRYLYIHIVRELYRAMTCKKDRIPLLLGKLKYKPALNILNLRMKEE